MNKKQFKENLKLTLEKGGSVWFLIGTIIADLKASEDKEINSLINRIIEKSIE